MSFKDQAPRWAAMASQLLGWRPDDFWKCTPSELATALHNLEGQTSRSAPDRELIKIMMERDAHG